MRAAASQLVGFLFATAYRAESGALLGVLGTPHSIEYVPVERERETLGLDGTASTDGLGWCGIVAEHDLALADAGGSRRPLIALGDHLTGIGWARCSGKSQQAFRWQQASISCWWSMS